MTRETLTTLYGNVGADPETRTFPGKDVTRRYYDAIADEVVEREHTTADKELVTFSIAINAEVPTGKKGKTKKITRWIRCDDWRGLATAAMVRKGDRVRLSGYFRERTYTKDGETQTAKNFVVQELTVERRKIRQAA